MTKAGKKLTVIWEQVPAPDAEERLAAAFAMLLGPPPREPPGEGLDG